jgi:exosortase family protein XrtF
MLSRIRSNPVFFFLLKAALLLLTWFCLYEFVLNPAGFLDHAMINNLIFFSSIILKLFGFPVIEQSFEGMRTMGIDGTNGVWIGDSCDGISLFAVFLIIIACFPGPAKTKLWYIPAGMLIIHTFNVLRITALALIVYYSPSSLDFNHTYTFQVLIYGIMFLLWIRWVNRYSDLRSSKKAA